MNFNSSCIYKELIYLLVFSGHERTAFLSTLVWFGFWYQHTFCISVLVFLDKICIWLLMLMIIINFSVKNVLCKGTEVRTSFLS